MRLNVAAMPTSPVQPETVPCHRDQRGLVFEPIDVPALLQQRNTHVVVTQPGHVRGNHYHPVGTEVCVVFGPALIRVRENGVVRDHPVGDGELQRFVFPPGVSHAYKNTGTTPLFSIAFNTVALDRANPDMVRDVLIEP